MKNLKVNESSQELSQLRTRIDLIDNELIQLLAERMGLVVQVGKLKKANGIPPLDIARWNQVLESKRRIGESLGLSPDLIELIWNGIHENALELEES